MSPFSSSVAKGESKEIFFRREYRSSDHMRASKTMLFNRRFQQGSRGRLESVRLLSPPSVVSRLVLGSEYQAASA